MFRIALIEFKHETNTFSNRLTTMDDYTKRIYLEEEAVAPYFRDTRTEMGGFFAVLDGQTDCVALPVLAADAMPAGPVSRETFQFIMRRIHAIADRLAPLDGVLLALHGAMVSEHSDDGDGELLAAIRTRLGGSVPLIATLDLHACITQKMVEHADALILFDRYPHVDQCERGMEAAEIMLRTLRGGIKPVVRTRKLPLILPAMPDAFPPFRRFLDMAHAYEQRPDTLSVGIAHGFSAADTRHLGVDVVATTDGDAALAQRIADTIADAIWQDRDKLIRKPYQVAEAVMLAKRADAFPVVLADIADNPGGGTPCDGTHLLRAMIEADMQDAVYALIYDPESLEAAMRAGVGNRVRLRLGGKTMPELMGGPIVADALVKNICDGRYRNSGPMNHGMAMDLRDVAVIQIGGVTVIVTGVITQPYDRALMGMCGIDETRMRVIALKSVMHFRAAYGPIAKAIYDVDSPGILPADPAKLPYQHIVRPIYPLDAEAFLSGSQEFGPQADSRL